MVKSNNDINKSKGAIKKRMIEDMKTSLRSSMEKHRLANRLRSVKSTSVHLSVVLTERKGSAGLRDRVHNVLSMNLDDGDREKITTLQKQLGTLVYASNRHTHKTNYTKSVFDALKMALVQMEKKYISVSA